jgi:hypothetical protein
MQGRAFHRRTPVPRTLILSLSECEDSVGPEGLLWHGLTLSRVPWPCAKRTFIQSALRYTLTLS